jgi:hypothetical protein
MDGRECHALIPYPRHRDSPGPPQFLEECAQLGRDTPGWSLFSAKSLLHCQSNFSQAKHRKQSNSTASNYLNQRTPVYWARHCTYEVLSGSRY